MSFYNRGGGFNRGQDSRRNSFGSRRPDRAEMFHATCDQCGKDCEVPFRPSGSKPVYCSECFESMGNRSSSRDSVRVYERRDNFGSDNRRSFGENRGESQGNATNYRDEFLALNRKIDRILEILSEKGKKDSAPAEEETPKEKITKRIKKAIKESKES